MRQRQSLALQQKNERRKESKGQNMKKKKKDWVTSIPITENSLSSSSRSIGSRKLSFVVGSKLRNYH
jgi:hypothetical protein